ncbi:hypothetical protein NDU88_002375 [Pleurodeles waltl]|uniref:Uncharacterized protein n=1 Tax=Pleurodeles waltl TaxID=8319 RepID=A0AAV7W283_PLEWA|nr:hypothetical protein NDU88_002375 [Pleurodeles waltl]
MGAAEQDSSRLRPGLNSSAMPAGEPWGSRSEAAADGLRKPQPSDRTPDTRILQHSRCGMDQSREGMGRLATPGVKGPLRAGHPASRAALWDPEVSTPRRLATATLGGVAVQQWARSAGVSSIDNGAGH